jgi:succinate dehydrogenase/fumarate reductase flavoprotein subunit
MKKYNIEKPEMAGPSLLWAVWEEQREGRDPLYLDFRHLPEKTLEIILDGMFSVERPCYKEFFESRSLDLRKDMLEVTLSEPVICGGHSFSGLVINELAETSLKGLYGAGDVAACGGALSSAFVMGKIAGLQAAKYSLSNDLPEIKKSQISKEIERVFQPYYSRGDLRPMEFERKIRRIVNDYIGSPKTSHKLEKALWHIDVFKKDFSRLYAEDAHELVRAFESRCILGCAEMAAKSSIERKESRWGISHYRVDYPTRDDKKWLKFIIIKKNPKTKKMSLAARPIQLYRGRCNNGN